MKLSKSKAGLILVSIYGTLLVFVFILVFLGLFFNESISSFAFPFTIILSAPWVFLFPENSSQPEFFGYIFVFLGYLINIGVLYLIGVGIQNLFSNRDRIIDTKTNS